MCRMVKDEGRSCCIDVLKGLAISAVFFYHAGGGYVPYGYLGVDIFLVIAGYLLIKSLVKKFEDKQFCYWSFLFRKIVRLWPLILIAGALSMLLGYFLMLPDDYENLAESVVSSSVFMNNVLCCITTKDYWHVANIYKPLMHLWYVGVLMQAYIVIPLVYLIVTKISNEVRKSFIYTTTLLTIISLGLYLAPSFESAVKFYYLPFRLFELTCGGLLVFVNSPKSDTGKRVFPVLSLGVIVLMVGARCEIISSSFMLLSVVAGSCVFVWSSKDLQLTDRTKKAISCFVILGRCSYSIYIWHQVFIAFFLYSVFSERSVLFFIVLIGLTAVFSFFAYNFIEKPLCKTSGDKKKEAKVIVGGIVSAIMICNLSFVVYMRAGVVRDVPELDVYASNVHRHMHAEYCDRPYAWSNEFKEDHSVHVLVLGNSFGRDWANVLYEYDNSLDIAYFYYQEESIDTYKEWINKADFVFYALGPDYKDCSMVLVETVPSEKFYIVGNKNFGESNGIVYARRGSDNFYNFTVKIPDELVEQNSREKSMYGSHYIDLIAPVQNANGEVRVFTDDDKYISQDCIHLTQSGAQYYARVLQLSFLKHK